MNGWQFCILYMVSVSLMQHFVPKSLNVMVINIQKQRQILLTLCNINKNTSLKVIIIDLFQVSLKNNIKLSGTMPNYRLVRNIKIGISPIKSCNKLTSDDHINQSCMKSFSLSYTKPSHTYTCLIHICLSHMTVIFVLHPLLFTYKGGKLRL